MTAMPQIVIGDRLVTLFCQHRTGAPCDECAGTDRDENGPIDADDVREAKLDADAFGHIFPEIRLALLVQVLRVLLRTPTIPAPSKRLIAATLDKIGERR